MPNLDGSDLTGVAQKSRGAELPPSGRMDVKLVNKKSDSLFLNKMGIVLCEMKISRFLSPFPFS